MAPFKNNLRRAHVVSLYCVGGLTTTTDGSSLIGAGLDHWFKTADGQPLSDDEVSEFVVEEWRLQEALGVCEFRLPPDYRPRRKHAYEKSEQKNLELSIPYLRFPRWYFCPLAHCKRMSEVPLAQVSHPMCPSCAAKQRRQRMIPVPFIAACNQGHLQDFPWNEWLHRTLHPVCKGPLYFSTAALASRIQVSCECGAERYMGNILFGSSGNSNISISDSEKICCDGKRPWLGDDKPAGCGLPLRATLRGSSHVYFPIVRSAIHIPRDTARKDLIELVELLRSPDLSPLWTNLYQAVGLPLEKVALSLTDGYKLKRRYTFDEVLEGLKVIVEADNAQTVGTEQPRPFDETAFKHFEYQTIRAGKESPELQLKKIALSQFASRIAQDFDEIILVKRLRETRAFAGFSRLEPDSPKRPDELLDFLWRNPPEADKRWLPAYVVYGEGIFLRFNNQRLHAWEERPEVVDRIKPVIEHYEQARLKKGYRTREISPRLLLLHSFAHALINRLTFYCGYSAASLRERLYVSSAADTEMSGILVYTAAGDSEGTMGGLVRMGEPGRLENVVYRAIEQATWCSGDPVCMEIGNSQCQGLDGCNLAACHCCLLVPETSCELFNRFLDRWVLVGNPLAHSLSHLGYFCP